MPAGRPAALEMHRLLDRCERAGIPVFFFGSEPRIVYSLRDSVAATFPRLRIAGICDADFEGEASPAIVDFIAGTMPGVIILDMAERDFQTFLQAQGGRFPAAALVHLDGAFGAYVLPWAERALPSREGSRSGAASLLLRMLRQGLSASRFAGIILAQFLQGGLSRVRVARSSAAMRRD